MSKDPTHFDWLASESAPEFYPMQIISGDLRYHGDPRGAGLYVPSGGVISHGWGRGDSTHVVGPDVKPLPDRLEITFYSYLEDVFYQGSFELPYDKILNLFQTEEAKPKKKDRNGDDIPVAYRILVGVAPGGTVAVWANARGNQELFFGQAKQVELDFAKAFRIPPFANQAKRTEYINKMIDYEIPAAMLADLRKNGIAFEQWAQYRTQYHWRPVFTVSHPPAEFGIGFYNGESGRYYLPYDEFTTTTHPVPKGINFSYAVNGQGIEYLYIITFDKAEMLETFARLGANHQPLQLEFDPKVPIELTQIRLRNEKEAITLKKFAIKEIK